MSIDTANGVSALPGGGTPPASDVLLDVRNLVKYFPVTGGVFKTKVADVKAVDGISFTIKRGETFGLVGESGSGKSTAGRAILRLQEPTSGEVFYDGRDLTKLSQSEMKAIRSKLQSIFQDPYSSLNPRLPVGDIIGEGLRAQGVSKRRERESITGYYMSKVGLRPE